MLLVVVCVFGGGGGGGDGVRCLLLVVLVNYVSNVLSVVAIITIKLCAVGSILFWYPNQFCTIICSSTTLY